MTTTLALESTVIAHGLPYPQNLETARALEHVARDHGVEPRTIAILDGEIKIGLSDDELIQLAQAKNVAKVSRRDIAQVIALKQTGATTVSATMWLAHRAGIRVFATGGIGGVHRAVSGATTSDVSADLPELAQTPVAVVCAGAKAILDLPATIEWLETHSVPVLGWQTDEFPAFYSRSSGLPVQTRVDTAEQAARLTQTHWELGMPSGVLITAPIPREYETPREVIEPFIARALREADEQRITGNAVTPFLLKRLAELTSGESVQTNIALLKNNVAVAAEIAKALALLDTPRM
ncbi:MAG: pseudouridine-5'-phosphate glycosidase [Chloroflexi bacterium]|nr:pseudouridine-5'-phosphate glycosidase [Chloroflexota bacterium]